MTNRGMGVAGLLLGAALVTAGGARAEQKKQFRAEDGAVRPPEVGERLEDAGKELYLNGEAEFKLYNYQLQLEEPQRPEVKKLIEARADVSKHSAEKRALIQKKTAELHAQILKLNHELRDTMKAEDESEARTRESVRALLKGQQLERYTAFLQERDRLIQKESQSHPRETENVDKGIRQ